MRVRAAAVDGPTYSAGAAAVKGHNGAVPEMVDGHMRVATLGPEFWANSDGKLFSSRSPPYDGAARHINQKKIVKSFCMYDMVICNLRISR